MTKEELDAEIARLDPRARELVVGIGASSYYAGRGDGVRQAFEQASHMAPEFEDVFTNASELLNTYNRYLLDAAMGEL